MNTTKMAGGARTPTGQETNLRKAVSASMIPPNGPVRQVELEWLRAENARLQARVLELELMLWEEMPDVPAGCPGAGLCDYEHYVHIRHEPAFGLPLTHTEYHDTMEDWRAAYDELHDWERANPTADYRHPTFRALSDSCAKLDALVGV